MTSDYKRKGVCVVGSINIDLVMRTPHFPAAGETLLGGPFAQHPGGKGANQAVAAARCGADVSMIGCVGDDDFGDFMRGTLRNEGIGVEHVVTSCGTHTGVAQIMVDAASENQIVVAPGANYQLAVEHLNRDVIAESDVLLMQLEIPMCVVLAAAAAAKPAGTRVVLNAAPAAPLSSEFVEVIDVLVVNRQEAALVSGVSGRTPSEMAECLENLGFETVIVTLGADGAIARHHGVEYSAGAPQVVAVDSVGAGDAFAGALAASLARGETWRSAMRFACAAGAIAATRHGAIPSLPRLDEVEALAASFT